MHYQSGQSITKYNKKYREHIGTTLTDKGYRIADVSLKTMYLATLTKRTLSLKQDKLRSNDFSTTKHSILVAPYIVIPISSLIQTCANFMTL